MSLWGTHSASTYVSKLELTLSCRGSVRSPPPAFESAAGGTAFGMVASSASPEGSFPFTAKCSPRETNPGTSASARAFCAAHSSGLDTTLGHANRGRAATKDAHCVQPSTASPFQVPWRYPSSSWDPLGEEAWVERSNCPPHLGSAGRGKQWSTAYPNASCSSMQGGDPRKHNIFSPSATSAKEPPSWTSRLDVVLDTSRASSPRPVSRFHTAFAPCGRPPSQQLCSRCMAHMSDLQGSVKWHMSTCSMAVKPFNTDAQGHNHAHSVLLVPKRWKMSNSSQSFPGCSQAPQQDYQPPETPALQITRFQVTSSTETPAPMHQTSTKEIWLSPAMLNRAEGVAEVVGADPDPNLFIFHNHHPGATGIRSSPCPGLIPTHHKVSEISLFLASPLAAMPFHMVRESRRSTSPTIIIQTQNPTTNGPSIQAGDGPTVSLTINPACCPEVRMAPQHLGPRPSMGAHSAGNMDPRIPFRNVQGTTGNGPHGGSYGGPSVVVSIAALESGRRVVKISVSSSRNPLVWDGHLSDGYRNITLGN